jgi:hypothetical protein
VSAATYVTGVALAAVLVGSLVATSVRLRRWAVPAWAGVPARLVEVTFALSILVVVAEVLGTVGAFRRVSLVAGCVLVALAVMRLVPVSPEPEAAVTTPEVAPVTWRTWPAALALVVVGVLVVQWLTRVALAYRDGIGDYDSIWYHLPFAARFVQHGWLTRFPYISPDFPTNFHPANAELLHGIAMAVLGRDFLSPLLNLGWLTVGLLAGWSIGRPWNRHWLTLLATAVVFGLPELTVTQAGTAGNDAASLALVALTAALLVHARDDRSRVVAALAAGLAVGTKLTLLAPVLALTVGVVVIAGRGRRARAAITWLAPVALTGSFWYLRNLVRAGSPVPSLDLGPLPAPKYAVIEKRGFSILHYATEPSVWRKYFASGLHDAFGLAWPVLLVAVAAGAVYALVHRGARPVERVLGASALFAGAAYVAMPTSAVGPPGRPILFYLTLRYAAPTLWLGLVLLAIAWPRGRAPLAVALTVVFLGSQRSNPRLAPWATGEHAATAVAVLGTVALVGAIVLAVAACRRASRPVLVAAAVVVAVLAVAAGFVGQREHYRRRYAEPVFAWSDALRDQRIGFAGFEPNYPFYGADLTNEVEYVGKRTPHGGFEQLATCDAWRQALASGHYDYVVLLPTISLGDSAIPKRQVAWSASDPRLQRIEQLEQPPLSVFRVKAGYRATPCA